MKWRKVYLFMLAALLVGLTVLLSAAAVRIWQEGSLRKAENPLAAVYTPENVKEQLLRISPLLIAVTVLTAAGLALGIRDEQYTRPAPSPEADRKMLASRLGEPGVEIRKERKKQRTIRWIRWTAFTLCMVPIAIYCADRGHFPERETEAMIASLALHTMPWAAAGLLFLLGGMLLEEKSMRRETDLARAQLKAGQGGRPAAAGAGKLPGRGITAVRSILLLAAGAMIILGALNGSLEDVLMKAINICTECIGLG